MLDLPQVVLSQEEKETERGSATGHNLAGVEVHKMFDRYIERGSPIFGCIKS